MIYKQFAGGAIESGGHMVKLPIGQRLQVCHG
jgi:hypothetical protein